MNEVRNYLALAVEEAEKALCEGNYPFGAVLTDDNGKIVVIGHNENFSKNDISAHAEIQCLRKMDIRKLLDEKNKYHLFCSGEPCGGCSFFIVRTNITHVTWALTDPQKAGFDDLRKNKELASFFEHIEVSVEPFEDLREKSALLLREYYQRLGQVEKAKMYE